MSETDNVADATTTDADEILSIWDIAETDVDAEETGKWFEDVFGNGTKVDLKLRRFTSKASLKARQKLEAPYRRKQKKGDLPEAVTDALMIDQIAEGILVDWKGVYGRDKKPLPFTVANAKLILKALPELVKIVGNLSLRLDNFRLDRREDIEGN